LAPFVPGALPFVLILCLFWGDLGIVGEGGDTINTILLEKDLSDRIALLEQWISECEARLKNAPPGRLAVQHSGGVCYYYCKNGNSRTYLRKDKDDLIRRLAQKAYDEAVAKAARAELEVLCEAVQTTIPLMPRVCPEKIYNQLSQERQKLVTPIYLSDEEFVKVWKNRTFPENTNHEKRAEFKSPGGVIVRSKTELLMATAFENQNVPFFYEPLLICGSTHLYPDFLVLNVRTRHEYYVEHFGMLDDPHYANQCAWKINFYAANNIIEGKQILYTLESSKNPISTAQIYSLIEEYLL